MNIDIKILEVVYTSIVSKTINADNKRYGCDYCTFHLQNFFAPLQNRGGVIFSLQFVCVSVCVSVCPALLVNIIPAKRMNKFRRGFH